MSGAAPAPDARLFAIDVDGTLLRGDKTLAPATVEAVRDAVDAGHHVCIASSRPPHGLAPYLDRLGLVDPAEFVAYQGAWIGSRRGGASISRERAPLEGEVADAIWRAAIDAGITANWHADDAWWVSRIDDAVELESSIIGASPVLWSAGVALPQPDKILLMGRTAELDAFAESVAGEVAAARSAPHLLEISRLGVDKSTGVAGVAERLGIAPAAVVAIGDGHNDLGLFAWAGHAVAMANAPDDVRARADEIAPANDADGVAAVLARYRSGTSARH